jgi:hypothetical protein
VSPAPFSAARDTEFEQTNMVYPKDEVIPHCTTVVRHEQAQA